jgi:DNA polymerase-4
MTSRQRAAPLAEKRATDVLHLDMDCFFAAVEVLHDPALAGRAVVVGGTGPRGVVASASYEARVSGVHSAMPMAIARGLCPDGVYLPGRFDLYSSVSRELRSILFCATPLVEPVALDEAYLDVSGAHRVLGPSREIAQWLRGRVRGELGLDCAVGVGSSKLFAKLASKAAKPVVCDGGVRPGLGVLVVEPDDELEFLQAHPVRSLPGVGPRTAERLASFGVSSVGDLALVGRESLVRLLGAASGLHLHDLARGRDDRAVVADRAIRSIGHEETFADDLRDGTEIARQVNALAARVAARCRDAGVATRAVTLKVRFADFTTVTRSRTFADATDRSAELADAARALLVSALDGRAVRLLGIQASPLVDSMARDVQQLQLFSPAHESERAGGRVTEGRRAEVDAATDAIRRRYGATAIGVLAAKREAAGTIASPAGPTRAD